ncbi:MAG TPA: hypothetical protein VLE91_02750 [Candidatus Saccharimonadales bacterium]|nr:hypothetical protein [Candidatus Saccharimonadales bacterium]
MSSEERLSRQFRRALARLRQDVDHTTLEDSMVSLDRAWQEFGGPDGTLVTRDDAQNLWRRSFLGIQRLKGEQLSTDVAVPDDEALAQHFLIKAIQFQAIVPSVELQHRPELKRRITACNTAIILLMKS